MNAVVREIVTDPYNARIAALETQVDTLQGCLVKLLDDATDIGETSEISNYLLNRAQMIIKQNAHSALTAMQFNILSRAAEICTESVCYNMEVPCPDGDEMCQITHTAPAKRRKTADECAEAIKSLAMDITNEARCN